jgi:transposase
VLRNEGIHLQRKRTWCVSTDPQFASKAADVVKLYLDPPENAVVICVDEKPSIQAIERPSGYVQADNGKIMVGVKSTYKRHGTLNLFSALDVANGQVYAQTTDFKKREDFRGFMDAVIKELPAGREIHVILDNYATHKRNDDWLAQYGGRVQFHFTPTSASWLNQVEIFFSLLARKALRGASFKSKAELKQAIEAFIAAHNQRARPFRWRKRDVRGSQLRNTLMNLCA